MRILITGGSGLLGSNLALQYTRFRRTYQVNVHTLYLSHKIVDERCYPHRCDLVDDAYTIKLLDAIKPQLLIHCAALTDLDYAERNPEAAHQINVEVTGRLARWAHKHKARFIYISTDSIFGMERDQPFNEDDKPLPLSVYARTKLAGENITLSECPNSLIVRTCIVGINAVNKLSMAEWFLEQLQAGRVINGFDDLWFSPIFAHDLAGALAHCWEKDLRGVYHIGGATHLTKYDFARRLATRFNYDINLIRPAKSGDARFVAPRPPTPRLDSSRFVRDSAMRLFSIGEALARFKYFYYGNYRDRLKAMIGE